MSLTPAQQALLAERLKGRRTAAPAPIPAAPDGPTPISAEQEQLVYHAMFAPRNPLYNECITVVRHGELDLAALCAAVDGLVARYDAWHSAIRRERGCFRQVVLPPPRHELVVHDLRGLDNDARDEALGQLLSALALEPYDLTRGAPVRPLVARTADDEHRLYLALHHLAFDGVTLHRIVLPELAELYDAAAAGREPDLPAPQPYRDYAVWQAGGPLDDELARHLPWWREHLAGAPTLDLPLDRPRPLERSFRGTPHDFTVDAAAVRRLRELGSRQGATLFHLLATAFAVALRDLTGQEDLVFATVADRRSRGELQRMVGYCLTPLPLRVRAPHGAAAADLVAGVRDELLDALSHNVPFERIVRDLDPPHPVGANPVFQAMIVLEPPVDAYPPGWSMSLIDETVGALLGHAKNDLHLDLDEREDGHLAARLIVSTELFDDATAQRFLALFCRQVGELATG